MDITGERQVAPTLEGIRRDHVARYEWAARTLPARTRVVDFACGIGYGTQILQDAGHPATGYDVDRKAIDYARTFYGRAEFRLANGECPLVSFGAAVCFETIEHVADPRRLLESLRGGSLLLASVPNEDVFPFGDGVAFHHRHYTKAQFAELLDQSGWVVREWWGQLGPESEVQRDVHGRTLIVVAERKGHSMVPRDNESTAPTSAEPVNEPAAAAGAADDSGGDASASPLVAVTASGQAATGDGGAEAGVALAPPEHVTILGLGPSLGQYLDIVKRMGGKHAYCDEVWGINAVAGVLMCDLVFHMDDVRIQEIRAKAMPDSNIARMLEWLRVHPGPIVTSRPHPDYPGLVPFPLEEVLNSCPHAYFNSTAAYAVAYAIFIGVKKISLYGIDFTWPNQHQAERGRACVEFWLGIAAERGISIRIPKVSTLMDAMHQQEDRLYGYDTLDVTIRASGNRNAVDFAERSTLPTAEEIERRYDHRAPTAEQVKRD